MVICFLKTFLKSDDFPPKKTKNLQWNIPYSIYLFHICAKFSRKKYGSSQFASGWNGFFVVVVVSFSIINIRVHSFLLLQN